MPKRIIIYSRTQPARMIVLVVGWLTFLSGLFIFTPWFTPSEMTPAVVAMISAPALVGGVLNFIASVPALLAVQRNTHQSLSTASFLMFMWYLFITLTRLFVITEPSTLQWVPTLTIALIMAIVYLEQSQYKRHEDEVTSAWKRYRRPE